MGALMADEGLKKQRRDIEKKLNVQVCVKRKLGVGYYHWCWRPHLQHSLCFWGIDPIAPLFHTSSDTFYPT